MTLTGAMLMGGDAVHGTGEPFRGLDPAYGEAFDPLAVLSASSLLVRCRDVRHYATCWTGRGASSRTCSDFDRGERYGGVGPRVQCS